MSLKTKVISGVKWTSFSTIILAIMNIFKLSVLTRYLEKEDFGLMAIVTLLIGLMELFIDMGLSSAILHKQNISNKEYSSLFWINILFSLVIFFLLFLISTWVATYYNEPELKAVIPITSLNIILSSLGRQYRTIAQKSLFFNYIATIDIASSILSLVVSVFLSLNNFGVYSLVYSLLAGTALSNICFLYIGVKKNGLSLYFNFNETKPFLKIGIYQVMGQFLNYINKELDILLIGKYFGSELLGEYNLAKQLASRPGQLITPIIVKVGISILPKFQDNNKLLRTYILYILRTLGNTNGLALSLMVLAIYPIIEILYGQAYKNIYFLVQLFAFINFLRSVGTTAGIVSITKGRTDIEFLWNLLTLIIVPISIFAGASNSIERVVIYICIIQLLFIIPYWFIFYFKLLNMNLSTYLSSFGYSMLILITTIIISPFTMTNVSLSILYFILISILFYIQLYPILSKFRNNLNDIKKL